MRHAFPEWYSHDEDTIRKIVTEGTIALDANVLLHLYRLGEHQREEVLTVLKLDKVRSRLWLPYQVGVEYHRNRLKVAYTQAKVYKDLAEDLQKDFRQMKSKIDFAISDADVRQEALKSLEKARITLSGRIDKLGAKHVIDYDDVRTADPVRGALDGIFASPNQIGKKPDDLEARIEESRKRYAAETPPGYADAKGKASKPHPEGDYLVWRELLDHATSGNQAILFVTNDKKEDWYQLDERNQIIGPRIELTQEMGEASQHPYHQTTLDGFLRLAKTHFAADVDDSTLANTSPPAPSADPDSTLAIMRKFMGNHEGGPGELNPAELIYKGYKGGKGMGAERESLGDWMARLAATPEFRENLANLERNPDLIDDWTALRNIAGSGDDQ